MDLLKVKRLTKTAKLPTKAHSTDAGWDVYADEYVEILPGETVKVKTGIAVQGNSHHLVWDRSSLGSKGIHRLAGVIDTSYSGELIICLTNLNVGSILQIIGLYGGKPEFNNRVQDEIERQTYTIKPGDKIAQVLSQTVLDVNIIEVDFLDDTDRGAKGFGSSGA